LLERKQARTLKIEKHRKREQKARWKKSINQKIKERGKKQ
jgi:hypothetical protein